MVKTRGINEINFALAFGMPEGKLLDSRGTGFPFMANLGQRYPCSRVDELGLAFNVAHL